MEKLNNFVETEKLQKQYIIDLPDSLIDFNQRKKAADFLNDKHCQKIEEKIMSRETDLSEDELIEYLAYMQNLQKESNKVDSWHMGEEIKQITKYFASLKKRRISFNELDIDNWKVENGKIIVQFKDNHPKKLVNNMDDSDENNSLFLYKNQSYANRTIDCLLRVGGKKSIDKIVELILEDSDWLYLHEDSINRLFKKNKHYAINKCLVIAEEGSLNDVQLYAIVQLLDYLQDDENIKKRLEKSLSELSDGNGHLYEADEANGIFTLAFILSSAKKQGYKIDFEKIKNLRLDIKEPGQDMEKSDKDSIIKMAEDNWSKQNPKMAPIVINGLRESLRDTSNQKYYTLKYQGKTISVIRFEPINKQENQNEQKPIYYFGSFNVDSEARGLGVGEEMMNLALIEESQKNILEGHVPPQFEVGTCYVEKSGFVLDGYIADYHKTGEPLFSMYLDKKQNEKYFYRNEGKKNKINEEQIKKQCISIELLDAKIKTDEPIVLKFDMQNDFGKMHETMQKLLIAKDDSGQDVPEQNMENKYKITRYFSEDKKDKNNHTRYFVFEKIK